MTPEGRGPEGTGPEGTGPAGPGPATGAASSCHRLLLLAPLRVEQLALSPGGRVGPTTIVVERIGMGLAKARESAERLSSAPPPDAVAVAGVGGALSDMLQPGDLVVAELVIDTSGREVAWLASAPSLAADLRHLGLRARSGTVVSTDHIVTGRERAMLAALGADVVDMESSAVADASWRAPLAVVRAVSDTPGQELFSPGGVAGALKALRALRASRRALANWAAATGPRTKASSNSNSNSNKKTEIFLAARRSSSAPAPDQLVNVSLPLEVR